MPENRIDQRQELLNKFLKHYSKIETVLLVVIVIAVIIRPSEQGVGSLMLIISMSTLAMLYMYKSYEVFKEINHMHEVFVQKLMGMGMAVAVVGILFRLLNWPGNKTMLIVGIFTLPVAIIVAITTIQKYKAQAIHTYKSLLRPFTILIFGALLLITPWHVLKENKIVFGEDVNNKEQIDSAENK